LIRSIPSLLRIKSLLGSLFIIFDLKIFSQLKEMVRKTILLNSGYKIPILGLGIWSVPHGGIGRIIKTALDIGYRYFDVTQAYGNEEEIGEAFEVDFLFTKINVLLRNTLKNH
jgi:hypothetical protein